MNEEEQVKERRKSGNTDLVSRQAVIDKINERQRKLIYCFGFENDAVKIMNIAKSIVSTIPSAQPETARRVVHASLSDGLIMWYECNKCGELVDEKDKFCPGCGGRLGDE